MLMFITENHLNVQGKKRILKNVIVREVTDKILDSTGF